MPDINSFVGEMHVSVLGEPKTVWLYMHPNLPIRDLTNLRKTCQGPCIMQPTISATTIGGMPIFYQVSSKSDDTTCKNQQSTTTSGTQPLQPLYIDTSNPQRKPEMGTSVPQWPTSQSTGQRQHNATGFPLQTEAGHGLDTIEIRELVKLFNTTPTDERPLPPPTPQEVTTYQNKEISRDEPGGTLLSQSTILPDQLLQEFEDARSKQKSFTDEMKDFQSDVEYALGDLDRPQDDRITEGYSVTTEDISDHEDIVSPQSLLGQNRDIAYEAVYGTQQAPGPTDGETNNGINTSGLNRAGENMLATQERQCSPQNTQAIANTQVHTQHTASSDTGNNDEPRTDSRIAARIHRKQYAGSSATKTVFRRRNKEARQSTSYKRKAAEQQQRGETPEQTKSIMDLLCKAQMHQSILEDSMSNAESASEQMSEQMEQYKITGGLCERCNQEGKLEKHTKLVVVLCEQCRKKEGGQTDFCDPCFMLIGKGCANLGTQDPIQRVLLCETCSRRPGYLNPNYRIEVRNQYSMSEQVYK